MRIHHSAEPKERSALLRAIERPGPLPPFADFAIPGDFEECGILPPTTTFSHAPEYFAIGLNALCSVPSPSPTLVRYELRINQNFALEFWSPNACTGRNSVDWKFRPFFPGSRPSLELGEPLPHSGMFATGTQGRFDYTLVPQVFEAERPWRGFILCSHAAGAAGPDRPLAFPEYLSVLDSLSSDDKELSALGSLGTPLLACLLLRAKELRETGPRNSDKDFMELADKLVFAELVARHGSLMARMKELTAFCRFAEIYPPQGLRAWLAGSPRKELTSPSPFAVPQFVGCWAHQASQAEFTFLVHARVPVYVIGMLGKDANVPRLTQAYRLDRELEQYLCRDRVNRVGSQSLRPANIPERILRDQSHEIRLIDDLGTQAQQTSIRVRTIDKQLPYELSTRGQPKRVEGENLVLELKPVGRYGKDELLPVPSASLYKLDDQTTECFRAPAVSNEKQGGAWEGWMETDEDPRPPGEREGRILILLSGKRSWESALENPGALALYDRQNKRRMIVYSPYKKVQGQCWKAELFGMPAPFLTRVRENVGLAGKKSYSTAKDSPSAWVYFMLVSCAHQQHYFQGLPPIASTLRSAETTIRGSTSSLQIGRQLSPRNSSSQAAYSARKDPWGQDEPMGVLVYEEQKEVDYGLDEDVIMEATTASSSRALTPDPPPAFTTGAPSKGDQVMNEIPLASYPNSVGLPQNRYQHGAEKAKRSQGARPAQKTVAPESSRQDGTGSPPSKSTSSPAAASSAAKELGTGRQAEAREPLFVAVYGYPQELQLNRLSIKNAYALLNSLFCRSKEGGSCAIDRIVIARLAAVEECEILVETRRHSSAGTLLGTIQLAQWPIPREPGEPESGHLRAKAILHDRFENAWRRAESAPQWRDSQMVILKLPTYPSFLCLFDKDPECDVSRLPTLGLGEVTTEEIRKTSRAQGIQRVWRGSSLDCSILESDMCPGGQFVLHMQKGFADEQMVEGAKPTARGRAGGRRRQLEAALENVARNQEAIERGLGVRINMALSQAITQDDSATRSETHLRGSNATSTPRPTLEARMQDEEARVGRNRLAEGLGVNMPGTGVSRTLEERLGEGTREQKRRRLTQD
ncbi:hypothetical protein CYLTODRAFT_415374 [Cylindrobasidium torrendii FP15055 ss-10]|uniref:Uncharacterized protein n=1 Tax=Cylindrobasidium torrendii FP15055 ss-10 TaxID=1314674 RepID=A0A0D7AW63_9AGAR|nr:hypothetical protein CYLTODRAFT_415374 [Cylindrobasidium torrendii FP15055 ss-10]